MFDNPVSDMDLHYFDNNCEAVAAVPEPVVGKLYAAQVSSDWHRVKVILFIQFMGFTFSIFRLYQLPWRPTAACSLTMGTRTLSW